MTSRSDNLPLRAGAAGPAVRDVQRRLAGVGIDVGEDPPGQFGPGTERAIRTLQERRGLRPDGICDDQTWSSLVEAGYRLGDRLLYQRAPMLRGDDVAELQAGLGRLGFDAGRVDGIFGPMTGEAVSRFQRNAGLTTDGICGPETVNALRRVADRSPTDVTVSVIREADRLRHSPRELRGRRLAVGEGGGLAAVVDALGHALSVAGGMVAVFHDPDESAQAKAANAFEAELYLAVAASAEPGIATAYYAASGFESRGGRRLAELVLEHWNADLGPPRGATGMRMAVLRETRMPAVTCEIGPPGRLAESSPAIVHALVNAVTSWIRTPIVEHPE